MEQESKRRPGRPATGVTPKRNVRIGATWDQAEQLARQLGMTTTAYVEEALRRENARVERHLARQEAASAAVGDLPVCGDSHHRHNGPCEMYAIRGRGTATDTD